MSTSSMSSLGFCLFIGVLASSSSALILPLSALRQALTAAGNVLAGPSCPQIQRQQSAAQTSSLSASMSACLALKWCLLAAQQLRGWLRYPSASSQGSLQAQAALHSPSRHLLQVGQSSAMRSRRRGFSLTCRVDKPAVHALENQAEAPHLDFVRG